MPGNNSFQNNNTILGQSFLNSKMEQENTPIARDIKLTGSATTFTPNLMHNHAFIKYIANVGDVNTVTFNPPIKYVNRTLLNLSLDNKANTAAKIFNFPADYIFLDEAPNTTSIIVGAGKVQIWYGAIVEGKVYFRNESDSTN
jgi:hypothetical protein